MRSTVFGSLTVLVLASVAAADASLDDRAAILRIELRRGPAEALEPYLAADADPALRRLAVRALGRIGDFGKAPPMLAHLLTQSPADLVDVLRAAGTAQSKALVAPIRMHLASEKPDVVAAAAAALGWCGEPSVGQRLLPLLARPEAAVRAGALESLARTKDDALLEPALALLDDPDPAVRVEAEFAAWMLARDRREAGKKKDPKWDGAPNLCPKFLPLLTAEDAERRMGGVRPLGILLPRALTKDGPFAAVFDLGRDADPRIVQDYVWRVLTPREGDDVDQALAEALRHADPKVRHLAAEALGKHGTERAKSALSARFADEPDARVREVLAVENARVGDETPWERLQAREDRPDDPALQAITHVRVLLASKRIDAMRELLALDVPPAPAAMALLEAMDEKPIPELLPLLARWIEMPRSDPKYEAYVVGSAASAIGKARGKGSLPALLALRGPKPVLQGVAEAIGALGGEPDLAPSSFAAMRARLRALMQDESANVRRAARASAKANGMMDVPEQDPIAQNDWVGLPRPAEPVFGVPFKSSGPWLTEEEILLLADAITEQRVRVVLTTTAGPFAVEVDTEAAPADAVGFVLAAHRGAYDGTRWHRVVPNFVIQGGDPYGHGAGDCGHAMPDEITENRFVRGALGMPKDAPRDTGGCQLFFMHTAYRPLDGRYSCYGRVVSGMETVDAIRVGDIILGARLVLP